MKLKKLRMPLLITIIVLLALWISWGLVTTWNIETPAYTVIEQRDGYEIREYEPYIVAETIRDGQFRQAMNGGFMTVADYIFGNNTSKQKIDMTAPVVNEESEKIAMTAPVIREESEKIAMTAPVIREESEKIDMTAPVIQERESSRSSIAFVMPSEYSMETLPTPNNDRVTLREVPGRKLAVLRFSWFYGQEKIDRLKQELGQMLERDGLAYSSFSFAAYNDPWTPPFMRRNEIWAELSE